jgi:predicted  nucleic acid-binding Zn-ribbon protein
MLNKYLEQLVELSKYDTQISSFEPQIKNEKAKLEVFSKDALVLKEEIDRLESEIKEIKSKKSKHDVHLSELKDKLNDIAKKGAIVQTEKEIKALQLEEEITKEQISFSNEEIARLDKLQESKNEALKEAISKLSEEEESIKELEVQISQKIEQLNVEREDISIKKGKLVEKIDPKILTFYEKVKRWAKNTAVVPVRKQACYGCYMKISDKAYAEVIKSEEIVTCPHCGRILYKEIEDNQ